MRRIEVVYLLGCLLGALCLPALSTQSAPPDVGDEPTETMSYWMEKKLDYSQSLLRALASGDFEAMRSSADQMRKLNQVEGFVRRRNPEYQHHLHTFQRVTTGIIRQAERENIEGVTLGFNQLTISCVGCHEALRRADAEETGSPSR